jgi:uncharacterized protein (DUF2249 family)
MRVSALFLAALLTGCAAIPSGTRHTVVREQSLRLQAGGEATLRVDCPPGQLGVSARQTTGGAFTVTESRAAEPGVWWVTFANPLDTPYEEDVSIRLTCR